MYVIRSINIVPSRAILLVLLVFLVAAPLRVVLWILPTVQGTSVYITRPPPHYTLEPTETPARLSGCLVCALRLGSCKTRAAVPLQDMPTTSRGSRWAPVCGAGFWIVMFTAPEPQVSPKSSFYESIRYVRDIHTFVYATHYIPYCILDCSVKTNPVDIGGPRGKN